MGEFSPDGRRIAYQTSESGKPEIVVRGFPDSKTIMHVSTAGGTGPRWGANGTQIYVIAPWPPQSPTLPGSREPDPQRP